MHLDGEMKSQKPHERWFPGLEDVTRAVRSWAAFREFLQRPVFRFGRLLFPTCAGVLAILLAQKNNARKSGRCFFGGEDVTRTRNTLRCTTFPM